jgi:peptide/nickel transport system permease protein
MVQFARFAMMRAAMALFTLLLVSFIVFSLMEMVPGDCAERYLAFKNTQGSQISVADIQGALSRLQEHARIADLGRGYRGREDPPRPR